MPASYLEAAAGLEAVGRDADAALAYRAAIAAWPESALPHLGLGNLAHARGDYVTAAGEYRAAAERDAADPVAAHNLAETLLLLGCPQQARAQIEVAQRLAGSGSVRAGGRRDRERNRARNGARSRRMCGMVVRDVSARRSRKDLSRMGTLVRQPVRRCRRPGRCCARAFATRIRCCCRIVTAACAKRRSRRIASAGRPSTTRPRSDAPSRPSQRGGSPSTNCGTSP